MQNTNAKVADNAVESDGYHGIGATTVTNAHASPTTTGLANYDAAITTAYDAICTTSDDATVATTKHDDATTTVAADAATTSLDAIDAAPAALDDAIAWTTCHDVFIATSSSVDQFQRSEHCR